MPKRKKKKKKKTYGHQMCVFLNVVVLSSFSQLLNQISVKYIVVLDMAHVSFKVYNHVLKFVRLIRIIASRELPDTNCCFAKKQLS